jgi:LmbE family N-acetylglucosaminyl deacetylase
MDALLERPVIAGTGTAEALWAAGAEFSALPAMSLAELVPEGARLVVVAPHPDDEVLGTGALISIAAAAGREILIIAVTDGEASHPHHEPSVVKRVRMSERSRALWELGLAANPVLRMGLPDGAVGKHIDALTAQLAQLLGPDDVVFCPWDADGHPDHEATALSVQTLCHTRGLRCFQVPIWGWHWCEPNDFPWARAVRLDITADTRRRKARALDAFRSQIEDDLEQPILPAATLEHFRRAFEIFLI